jgi:hypothetical protein
MEIYAKELTQYARRVLRDLYVFAAQNEYSDSNAILKIQVAELLAFASDGQINEIAKRLNREKSPADFIANCHGAWLESPYNPALLRPQKPRKINPKAVTKIATIRKYFK